MDLTSTRRVRMALGISTTDQDAILSRLVPSSSARVEDWLRRPDGIELRARTDTFSPYPEQNTFSLIGYPVTSISSVKIDPTGLYNGHEITLDSTTYTLDSMGRNLILFSDPLSVAFPNSSQVTYIQNYPGQKSVRVAYTGGIAASATISVWSKAASSFTVGKYVTGNLSGCVAYITATSSLSISLELLAGRPIAGETLTEYTDMAFKLSQGGGSNATGVTAVLGTNTTPSLCDVAPSLVEGTEMFLMYLLRNRNTFEQGQLQQGIVGKQSASDRQKDFFSFPENRDMLDQYKDKRPGYVGQR